MILENNSADDDYQLTLRAILAPVTSSPRITVSPEEASITVLDDDSKACG